MSDKEPIAYFRNYKSGLIFVAYSVKDGTYFSKGKRMSLSRWVINANWGRLSKEQYDNIQSVKRILHENASRNI